MGVITPKSSISIGFSLINHQFYGKPYVRKIKPLPGIHLQSLARARAARAPRPQFVTSCHSETGGG